MNLRAKVEKSIGLSRDHQGIRISPETANKLSSALLGLGVITFLLGFCQNEFVALCLPSFIIVALSIAIGDYH